jgi:hypothetical protein
MLGFSVERFWREFGPTEGRTWDFWSILCTGGTLLSPKVYKSFRASRKGVNYGRNKTVSFSKLLTHSLDLKLATIIVYYISEQY